MTASAPEHGISNRLVTVAAVILAVLAVVGALSVGRQFFIPIALALFFNTLLRPLVRRLERFRLPTPAAAAVVVLILLGTVGATGAILAGPAEAWMQDAPTRLRSVQDRVRRIWRPVQRVTAAAGELGRTATQPDGTKPAFVAAPPSPMLEGFFGTTATVVAGLVEVILLLYLLLASGSLFLERLLAIIPKRVDQRTAVQIATEVEDAVSHYLGITTVINIGQGLVVGAVLWALGMPDPGLWAALTIFLEFIPYLGGAVLVALLSVSALGSFPTIGEAALIPAAYLVITTVQNNIVSPLLYGQRLKLNAVAVLVAVIFWGSLWGILGALLAVPMLASAKIMCDHIEALAPLGKFLES